MDRPSPLPGRGLGVGESISIPHPSSEGEGLSNAPTLRGIALYAIENTRWVPERSKNRIRSMVEGRPDWVISRSEEHTSELQSLMRISYAVFCLKKKNTPEKCQHHDITMKQVL